MALVAGEPDEPYENAPCGLLSTRDDGLIVRVNRTFCEWLGIRAGALVERRRFQDLLTVGGKIFHQTHWAPLLSLQGAVPEVDLDLVTDSGAVLPVLVSARRREATSGTRHDLALFVTHDRRTYEQELRQARRRAEQLLESERAAQEAVATLLQEREREAQQRAQLAEQLIGMVSHDLRTPLNAVLFSSQMFDLAALSTRQAWSLSRIVASARRANRLVDDLLDFTATHLGSGLPTHRGEIDLHAVVKETVEELKVTWPGRALSYVSHGVGVGCADPDRIAQVVTNLVNNAMTYGAPDEAVSVLSRAELDAWRLEVHNFGAPIPDDVRPHIFAPLRRGDAQIEAGMRSVGLGLYIVQQIARAHGGRVEVQSNARAGTTFAVTIPRSAADQIL